MPLVLSPLIGISRRFQHQTARILLALFHIRRRRPPGARDFAPSGQRLAYYGSARMRLCPIVRDFTQSLFNPNYATATLTTDSSRPSEPPSTGRLLSHAACSVAHRTASRSPKGWPALVARGVARQNWIDIDGDSISGWLCVDDVFTLKTYPFVASAKQFAVIGALVVVPSCSFSVFRGRDARYRRPAPSPWLAGTVTLVLSSGFYLLYGSGQALLRR